MRKLSYILLVFLFPVMADAQQLPHYSLYMLNDVVVNPSLISTKVDNQISLMVRDQWTGFEGSPKTQLISYYDNNHLKYGRGISIVNDNTGPISMLSATLSGSYLLPVESRNKFAIGASANILQYKMENSEIILEDDGIVDPAMQGGVADKVIGGSASIGANYFSDKFHIAASVLNVLNSDLNLSNTGVGNSLVNHYCLNAAYTFSSSSLDITPSLMMKKIGASNIQMDINLRTSIKKTIWMGVSYRTHDAFIAMLGLNFGNYNLGYSYDITTTKMNIPSYGSHGIVLTYNFKKIEKDTDKDGVLDKDDDCIKVPGLIELNGCPDRDKDGVRDKDDECPDFPGLKKNDGCPDIDNDGVIDKYDRCPTVPGIPEQNGCPDSDGDGLQDQLDKCPYVKGSIRNMGCPDTLVISEIDTVIISEIDTLVISEIDTVVIVMQKTFYDSTITWHNISLWADRVHFEFNKYNLDENSKIILNRVAEFLIENTDKDIEINGHADERGTDRYNVKLSRKRAEEVKKYLVKQGVSKNRLTTNGLGESEHISSSHAENRRVEFKVLD